MSSEAFSFVPPLFHCVQTSPYTHLAIWFYTTTRHTPTDFCADSPCRLSPTGSSWCRLGLTVNPRSESMGEKIMYCVPSFSSSMRSRDSFRCCLSHCTSSSTYNSTQLTLSLAVLPGQSHRLCSCWSTVFTVTSVVYGFC